MILLMTTEEDSLLLLCNVLNVPRFLLPNKQVVSDVSLAINSTTI